MYQPLYFLLHFNHVFNFNAIRKFKRIFFHPSNFNYYRAIALGSGGYISLDYNKKKPSTGSEFTLSLLYKNKEQLVSPCTSDLKSN